MKQLLFLLLFPCLCVAQYTGNAGQKITLGEQTSADGLVFRGVANIDTVTATSKITRANKQDTSAYILLDTVTNLLWHYQIGSNKWTKLVDSLNNLQGQLSLTTKVTGTLPVANGGTNTSTAFTAGSIVFAGTSGTYTQDNTNLFWNNTSKRLGIGTASPTGAKFVLNSGTSNQNASINGDKIGFTRTSDAAEVVYFKKDISLGAEGTANINGYDGIQFRTQGAETVKAVITSGGNVGIGTTTPAVALHVVGNGRFTAVGGGTFANNLNITSDGTLTTATSDEKYKYNILPISYGLNTILQLKPVNFQWIEGEENDLGFIAQDVAEIIPEAVNTNWNSDLLMRYESIIPILTKAIQEQNAIIKALEQRILTLENK